MKAAIKTMLSMQNRMNHRVHEQWIEQEFEWYRAIWIECGELMDHVGYKWWKKQEMEVEQVRLEVVDIWHFGLSALFKPEMELDDLAERIVQEMYHAEPDTKDIREATEQLALHALRTRGFSVSLFVQLMVACELSFKDLYRRYIGKNVLNFFRQDHGYKSGSYVKVWAGREDNEHLTEILTLLDADDENFPQRVYAELELRYPA